MLPLARFQGENTKGVAGTIEKRLLETSCLRTSAVFSQLLEKRRHAGLTRCRGSNTIHGLHKFVAAENEFWYDAGLNVLLYESPEVVIA